MKDGKPYSTENGYIDAALITEHLQQEIDIVFNWIAENISPRKTPLLDYTSYGLKHILERDTGIYMTNNEFKDAMLSCGYAPVNPNELNWNYCISKHSLAFDPKARKK
jgi:hypothetical protein